MEEESTCKDNTFVLSDPDYGPIYCWQTLSPTTPEETVTVDNFPLLRHPCGFFSPDADHSAHEQDRVRFLVREVMRLSVQVSMESIQENSEQDCDYFPFTRYIETPISRDPKDIRAYLSSVLMVDPVRSRCHRTATAENPHVLLAYPSILDEDAEKRHKAIDDAFLQEFDLKDTFFFAGAGGSGTEPLNTYPVVYAGFTEDGDMLGVYSIRVDT